MNFNFDYGFEAFPNKFPLSEYQAMRNCVTMGQVFAIPNVPMPNVKALYERSQ